MAIACVSAARLAGVLRDLRGGVSIIGALSLTGMIGMGSFAVEVSQGYSTKVHNQRIADAAALAAAMAYRDQVIANAATPEAVIIPTVGSIMAANGLPTGNAATEMSNATTPAGNVETISVTVRADVPLRLARVITTRLSYTVSSNGQAAVTTPTAPPATTSNVLPACIYALSPTAATGIDLSGVAAINAPNCSIMSNRLVRLTGSTSINAGQIWVNGDIKTDWSPTVRAAQLTVSGSYDTPNPPSIQATPDATKKYSGAAVTVADPLAGNTALAAALADTKDATNFPSPAALTNPTTPGGAAWSLDGGSGSGAGLNATWRSGSTWTIPANTYNLQSLTISGSCVVTFAAGSTVTINNGLKVLGSSRLNVLGTGNSWKVNGGVEISGSGNGGAAANFGDGTYHFAGATSLSNTITFGAGDVTINGATTLGGSSNITMGTGNHKFASLSVGGSTNLTIGDGDLVIGTGLTLSGATTVRVNMTGAARAISIGAAGGTSINLGGSAVLAIGDPASASNGSNIANTFVASGGITTAGTSVLRLPAAANHYIGGTVNLDGSAYFGKGAYTINGNLIKSASLPIDARLVSFFLRGYMSYSGASSSYLTAPTSASDNAGDALLNLLVASLCDRTSPDTVCTSSAAASWSGSTGSHYSGTLYLPKLALSVSGAGTIDGCFTLIGSTISLSGSATAATACSNIGSGGSGTSPATPASTTPTISLIR